MPENKQSFSNSSGTSIDKLGLSVRARNSLLRAGVLTIEDLSELEDYQLLQFHGLGEWTLQEIKQTLNTHQEVDILSKSRKILNTKHTCFIPWWDDSSIYVLNLSSRARAALLKEGISSISDLLKTDLQDRFNLTLTVRSVQNNILQKLGNYLLNYSRNIELSNKILDQPISIMELPAGIGTDLASAGIHSIAELISMTPKQICNVSVKCSASLESIKLGLRRLFRSISDSQKQVACIVSEPLGQNRVKK